MSLIVVNRGENNFLDAINGQQTVTQYTIHLYKNDPTAGLTPAEIDELAVADFDEATFAGYAEVALNGGWSTVNGDPSRSTHPQVSFTRSSTGTPETVQGYYVTMDFDSDEVAWFEPFDGPVIVENINDEVQVNPILTLDDRSGNVSVPIGGSILWAGPTADIPDGFLLRNGQAVSRTTFAELFALIGTTYGAGNGTTTFNIPDSRQRFPLGVADSGTGATLGGTGGSIDHVHGLDTATSHARVEPESGGSLIRWQRKTVASWSSTQAATGVTIGNTVASTALGTALGGDSDDENPPFLAEYFIIRAR